MSDRSNSKAGKDSSESGDSRFEIMRGVSILIALAGLAIAYIAVTTTLAAAAAIG